MTVLEHVVQLLADPRRLPAARLAAMERLLPTAPTRQRTGRQYPRRQRSAAHRLRFAKYGKRELAQLRVIALRAPVALGQKTPPSPMLKTGQALG